MAQESMFKGEVRSIHKRIEVWFLKSRRLLKLAVRRRLGLHRAHSGFMLPDEDVGVKRQFPDELFHTDGVGAWQPLGSQEMGNQRRDRGGVANSGQA